MKTFSGLLPLLACTLSVLYGQQVVISGKVLDGATRDHIPYATIHTASGQGAVANTYGFFSLTVPVGKQPFTVYSAGYAPLALTLDLRQDTSLEVLLNERLSVDTLEIRGQGGMTAGSISQLQLSPARLSLVPAIGGERDILKSLQLLPGITFGMEGTAQLMVRGGSPDQNLVTLDELPLYNVTHLFGFFSLFPPDALKSVTVIKGAFPAKYGGRLSSVIDLQANEGDKQRSRSSLTLGTIASQYSRQGPVRLRKGWQSSYFVSGRLTNLTLLARPASYLVYRQQGYKGSSNYGFWDGIAKLHIIPSQRDQLYVSLYAGQDRITTQLEPTGGQGITLRTANTQNWGNIACSVRYVRTLSRHLFISTLAGFTSYAANNAISFRSLDSTRQELASYAYRTGSGIREAIAKQTVDVYPAWGHFQAGLEQSLKWMHPSISRISSSGDTGETDSIEDNQRYFNGLLTAFAACTWNPSRRFQVVSGLRAEGFFARKFVYPSLQPRFSARYRITERWSAEAGYSAVAQYIHLLSQTGSGMPTDVWMPATATATPSTSHQWVAGVHGQVGHGIGLSWETFYKTMHHLIDYKDVYAGDRSRWEQRITQGKGTSYGTEILIEKQQGRLQGWASYTLSWSTRQFDALNGGAPFPFRYDRRHNLATTATWSIRPGKMLSASWMYTSGARVTLPQQAIAFPGNWMPADHVTSFITGNPAGWFGYDGGSKNNYQIRPFHKLDISFTKTKAKKTGQAQWSYGVYNLYARKNPFHVFPTYKFDINTKTGTLQLTEVSIFVWIPFLSWTRSF